MRKITPIKLISVAIVLVVGLLIAIAVVQNSPRDSGVNVTQIVQRLQEGDVTKVVVHADGRTADVTFTDKTEKTVVLPPGESFTNFLTDSNIPPSQWPPIQLERASSWSAGSSLILKVVLIVAIGGFMVFMFRKLSPGSIGSNTARRGAFEPIRPGERLVTFDDVAGSDEVKEEVADIVDFLREPDRFREVGARIPRGVLLAGPPGTGKTLIARALAGEARASFFSVSGSEFVELYVGVGASRVRELFRKAKENAPSIIFIDEIDAIGRRRGRAEQSTEYDQTLNQILVEMDGFEERTTVVVVAATNRIDILDSALLRPGRFDRKVVVDLPDRAARAAILGVHGRGKPFEGDVDFDEIAARTTGMTGADLSNIVNEAAILAGRARRPTIGMPDMLEALDRTIAGPARNSRRFTERERQVVAYHEAGHAVVAHLLPNADTVRKVSIVSRGQAGGYTMIIPDEDRGLWTRAQLSDRLSALLGGLAAEEITFGDITTGSSNDLERTSSIASSMVHKYGMSQRFGLLSTMSSASEVGQISPQTAYSAEQETRELVSLAHETALMVLRTHREDLERVAQRLLEVETIEASELAELINAPQPMVIPAPASSNDSRPTTPEPEPRPARARSSHRVGRAAVSLAAFTRQAVANAIRRSNQEVDPT
ncbi:MAG TPA: ATP-dependent zinc metalloprotease FtsH [Nitrolancea sp.]|nr:ATP-dependent zinc metalloprotease FtsH [Nitrolancea sp.]